MFKIINVIYFNNYFFMHIFYKIFISFLFFLFFYWNTSAKYLTDYCDNISDNIEKHICLKSIEFANTECISPSSLGKYFMNSENKKDFCSVSKIALNHLWNKVLESYNNKKVCKKTYSELLKEKSTIKTYKKIDKHMKDEKYNFSKFYSEVWYYTNCFNNVDTDSQNKHTIFVKLISKALWLEESIDLSDKFLNNKLILKHYIDNHPYSDLSIYDKTEYVNLPTSHDSELRNFFSISNYLYWKLKKLYEKKYKKLIVDVVWDVIKEVPKSKNIWKKELETLQSNLLEIIDTKYENKFHFSSLIWKNNIFNASLALMDLSDDLSWFYSEKLFKEMTMISNDNFYSAYTADDDLIKSSILSSYFTLKNNKFTKDEIKKYLIRLSIIIIEHKLKSNDVIYK